LAEEGWDYAEVIDFKVGAVDTTRLFNIYLDVDHTIDYSYQNLYTKIQTVYPSGEVEEDVVSLELADKSGAWLGRCGNKDCTLRVPLLTNIYFRQEGEHHIRFEQFMRVNPLVGIQALSLSLEDVGPRNSTAGE